jgi:hypothetical protein
VDRPAVLRRALAAGDDRACRRCRCPREGRRTVPARDLGRTRSPRARAGDRRPLRVRRRGRRTRGGPRAPVPCGAVDGDAYYSRPAPRLADGGPAARAPASSRRGRGQGCLRSGCRRSGCPRSIWRTDR